MAEALTGGSGPVASGVGGLLAGATIGLRTKSARSACMCAAALGAAGFFGEVL